MNSSKKEKTLQILFLLSSLDVVRILASFLILLSISEVGGENITSLGQTPDWSKLDAFQNKCSMENFRSELEEFIARERVGGLLG